MSVRSYRFRVREHDFSITFADNDKSFDVVCDALRKGLGIIDNSIWPHDPAPYDLHTEEVKSSPYVSDTEPFVLDFSNTGKFVLELDVPGSRKLVIKGDGGYKPFTDPAKNEGQESHPESDTSVALSRIEESVRMRWGPAVERQVLAAFMFADPEATSKLPISLAKAIAKWTRKAFEIGERFDADA